MRTLTISTKVRESLVDITGKVAETVAQSGVNEGICLVYAPHTTAGITINENADPDVAKDLLNYLGKLVPADFPFLHSEGNSDAHVKAMLLGSSVTVPVTGGKLAMGKWQGIYFGEFDGPRSRRCIITVLGE